MNGVGAVRRWWSQAPARDAVLALAVTVALLYGSYGEAHPSNPGYFQGGHHLPHTPAPALILVAVACLALIWRRRWPVAVLGVSVAAATIYTLLGYVNGAVLVAPMAALYTVAAQTAVREAVAYGLGTLVVLGSASIAVNPLGPFGGGVEILPFMIAVVVVAGIAVANRRAYVDSIRDRAEQDARRRLDEERLRIARELHDVVAHTMATINVQAGVAAHVLPTHPEAVAESLQAIKTASKEGLRELRAILNVLRQADDADPTQPAPGTARLEDLIAGARRAGLETTLTVTGDPVPSAGRGGSGRLPDHPGIADQHHPARRPGHRRGIPRLRRRRGADRRDRHRPRPARHRGQRRRPRARRDARARRGRRRYRRGRTRPGRRLPGRRPAAPAGRLADPPARPRTEAPHRASRPG